MPSIKYFSVIKHFKIRAIEVSDNASIAKIIRDCLTEFNANKPGTAYYDAETDHLFELFQTVKSYYFIFELNRQIMGGAGIFPTKGLSEDTCELVKMYLHPSVRGFGYGSLLLEKCIEIAMQEGYKKIYLETLPELSLALKIYDKHNFFKLNGPLGASGHHACDIWLLKNL